MFLLDVVGFCIISCLYSEWGTPLFSFLHSVVSLAGRHQPLQLVKGRTAIVDVRGCFYSEKLKQEVAGVLWSRAGVTDPGLKPLLTSSSRRGGM